MYLAPLAAVIEPGAPFPRKAPLGAGGEELRRRTGQACKDSAAGEGGRRAIYDGAHPHEARPLVKRRCHTPISVRSDALP